MRDRFISFGMTTRVRPHERLSERLNNSPLRALVARPRCATARKSVSTLAITRVRTDPRIDSPRMREVVADAPPVIFRLRAVRARCNRTL